MAIIRIIGKYAVRDNEQNIKIKKINQMFEFCVVEIISLEWAGSLEVEEFMLFVGENVNDLVWIWSKKRGEYWFLIEMITVSSNRC